MRCHSFATRKSVKAVTFSRLTPRLLNSSIPNKDIFLPTPFLCALVINMVSSFAIRSAGMGGRAFRDKCRAYLAAANDQGKVATEVAQLKVEIENRDATIAKLEERLAVLEEDKPKRGRPRAVDLEAA